MKEYTLSIVGHSADLKTSPTGSKDTGIFFPQELIDFLGSNEKYSFRIYKEDCAKAMAAIISALPLYSNKGGNKITHSNIYEEAHRLMSMITNFFGINDIAIYSGFYLSQTTGSRRYLYGLEQNGFSIRKFLVADNSILKFQIEDDGSITLRFQTKINAPQQNSWENLTLVESNDLPLQQIYYGAPGTGKSHTINELTEGESVIRTTFHPDSDYSTFVGAYKPTMGLQPICDELGQPMKIGSTVLHKEQIVYEFVSQAFLQAYVEAWKKRASKSVVITNGTYRICGVNDNCILWQNITSESDTIHNATRDSVKMHFDATPPNNLKANAQEEIAKHLKSIDSDFDTAWSVLDNSFNNNNIAAQYLVIEEINRGNCAQIFGDLFQLLDRNDFGFSVYPINADKDMKKQLQKAFKGINITNAESINQQYKGRDVVNEVLNGDILLLPNNLYIWATMNTSDQSLFPIDSAFKRRWEWQYMPIGKGYDADGKEIKWAIEGKNAKYDWWSFLEKINAQVGEATQSEDKKLGFFFCKGTDGVISAEKFVGKVIFYLWNDVFKNNGFEGPIFKDVDGTELSFGKFYKSDTKGNAIVQKDKVELFLTNLGVEEAGTVIPEEQNENEVLGNNVDEQSGGTRDSRNRLHVTFPDGETIRIQTCDEYVQILEKIGLDKAYEVAISDGPRILGCTFVTKTPEEVITNHKTLRYDHIGEYYVLRQMSGDQMRPFLEKISNRYNLGLKFYRE